MKKYSTLLFDADMTLFDFDSAEATAFGIVMDNHGIQYTEAEFERYKRINASLWERFGRGEITKEELQSERFTVYLATLGSGYTVNDGIRFNAEYIEALSDCSNLFSGARDLCRKLSEYYDMYIVTNGISRIQKKRFATSEIFPYFRDIFVSEDAGAPKPMPAYFNYVFGVIGEWRRASSVIIGDSLSSDIVGGINAGIDTVFYNPSGINTPTDIVPTYTVENYAQLEKIFLQGEI
jgi:2-haloacid dehalogenase